MATITEILELYDEKKSTTLVKHHLNVARSYVDEVLALRMKHSTIATQILNGEVVIGQEEEIVNGETLVANVYNKAPETQDELIAQMKEQLGEEYNDEVFAYINITV